MTDTLFQDIADTLSREIADGAWPPGRRLPGEAALAARFGVHRHTVRRALERLADEGRVYSRRGAGTFVSETPTPYVVGRRARFTQALGDAGHVAGRDVLSLLTRQATPGEAAALDLAGDAAVHVYEGVALLDGVPVGLFRSRFPAEPFPDLPGRLRGGGSVTEALFACGVSDHVRRESRIEARPATPTEAARLRLSAGEAVMVVRAINVDAERRPVEYGRSVFAGSRLTLVIASDQAS